MWNAKNGFSKFYELYVKNGNDFVLRRILYVLKQITGREPEVDQLGDEYVVRFMANLVQHASVMKTFKKIARDAKTVGVIMDIDEI